VTVLHESGGLSVLRFDHPSSEEPHEDPDEEAGSDVSVSFMESGTSFEQGEVGRVVALSAGTVFLSRPGVPYRYRHRAGVADDVCLSVRFDVGFVERDDALAARLAAPRVRPDTNRARYLALRLSRLAARGEALGADETAAALLRAAVFGDGARPVTYRQLRFYSSRVDAARDRLAERFDSPHALGALAKEAGMSPFHFARVFAELTGAPPHRFLLNERLRRGAERLRQGDAVTETAFAVGFSSAGHFSRAFRRRYGVSPSSLSGDSQDRASEGGARDPD